MLSMQDFIINHKKYLIIDEWMNEWLIKWMIIRSDLDPCCFSLYFYMVRTGLDSTFLILVYLRLNMIINNTPKWFNKDIRITLMRRHDVTPSLSLRCPAHRTTLVSLIQPVFNTLAMEQVPTIQTYHLLLLESIQTNRTVLCSILRYEWLCQYWTFLLI